MAVFAVDKDFAWGYFPCRLSLPGESTTSFSRKSLLGEGSGQVYPQATFSPEKSLTFVKESLRASGSLGGSECDRSWDASLDSHATVKA